MGWTLRGFPQVGSGVSTIADQSESRKILTGNELGAAGAGSAEDRRAEILGMARAGLLQQLFYAIEAELLFGAIIAEPALDDPTGNEQQSGARFHSDGRAVAGGMGKKSQRQARRGELRGSGMVVQQGRSVSSIGIAEGSEFFVVTRNEGRARMHALRVADEPTVESQTELGHGVGFVDVELREQLCANAAEDALGEGKNAAIFFAASGHVEEPEQDALGADAEGIVKVASYALADERGGDFGSFHGREKGWDRLDCRRRFIRTGLKDGAHEHVNEGNVTQREADRKDMAYRTVAELTLSAKVLSKILGQIGLKLTVVGVDGATQGGLGGIALAQALEDALDIAHPIGLVDIGHGREGFGVSHIGLSRVESGETSLESVDRYVLL